ncbi:MAG: prolyl oligopeptidase family serine peptidase [Acidobacteriota bacterium]|nr:prolyl oligopeptidase family serine peptidase [Acidobacteriota bacterium]
MKTVLKTGALQVLFGGLLLAAPSFTLEQVLGSPFPSELRAAPTGGKVAWVLNARGVRNIWVAGTPDFEGRQITPYKEDDGRELTELQWSKDGHALVYTRGDGANGKGEYPNPRNNPAGASQDICAVSIDGGEPKVLGQGASPTIAPDDKSVAFVWKGEIWSAPLDGHSKPEQLIHARGKADTLRWSPDGSRLAFVSDRGNHSFIAVYSPGQKTLRFLDPSVDEDAEPVWSPDGKQIAFVRVPASREAFAFGPKRAAQPWSIRIADATTGVGRQIWKAQEGAGSRFWPMVAEDQLLWGNSDRLVFPWEREGWLHLYSTSVRDGGATLLTPGEFEIEHVTLNRDGKMVVFSSNQGDIDRRHIWKVPVAGGTTAPVTTGTGIEWSPVMTSDGQTVVLHSTAQVPAEAAVVNGSTLDKTTLRALVPLSGFPSQAMIAPQQVILTSADGMRIHGQLFLPPNSGSNAKHPAVVFFHGGSRRQMLLGWHYMFYYHQAYAFNQYLASQGYIVLSVNYRSGIGYGLDFREAKDYGATGASEYNDVIGAGLYLRGRADVDQAHIGLWGGSYGGFLTALGLARASDLFAAGVDLHGVHDWNSEISIFAPGYDPEKQHDAAKLAFESSPMAFMKTWRSPVLLIQGDDDRNVNFSQSVMLAEALRKQNVPFEQLVFPDEIHDFLVHEHWLAAYHAADTFFAKYLKK